MDRTDQDTPWYRPLASVTYKPATLSAETRLTPRECEFVGYHAKGFTLKQVASLMGIHVTTGNEYAKNVYAKLGIHDVKHLTQAAIEAGMVGLPDADELRELIPRYQKLTPQEREVMQYVAFGDTAKQIAKTCQTEPYRVNKCLRSVRDKMGIEEHCELIRAWVGLKREADRLVQRPPIIGDMTTMIARISAQKEQMTDATVLPRTTVDSVASHERVASRQIDR